jgi:N-acetylmuramoyl-L-alanine amidase CwlA
MLPITRNFLTHPTSRPALRSASQFRLRKVKAIVVHWTANVKRGANAMANRNYFNLGSRPASAHYLVDDRTIVQALPEYEVGFHCGDRPLGKYKPAGLDMIKGEAGRPTPNFFTIGVEMCVNSDGDFAVTRDHTIDLIAWLLFRHVLHPTQLLRHFDVTGKNCPAMLLDPAPWAEFRAEVAATLAEYSKVLRGRVISKGLNVRSGPGVEHPILTELKQGEPVALFPQHQGDWWLVEEGGWVNTRFVGPW